MGSLSRHLIFYIQFIPSNMYTDNQWHHLWSIKWTAHKSVMKVFILFTSSSILVWPEVVPTLYRQEPQYIYIIFSFFFYLMQRFGATSIFKRNKVLVMFLFVTVRLNIYFYLFIPLCHHTLIVLSLHLDGLVVSVSYLSTNIKS